MTTAWIRRCQECGHKQKAKEPSRDKELSSSYRNLACRHCGSEALDYGSEQQLNENGKITQEYWTE